MNRCGRCVGLGLALVFATASAHADRDKAAALYKQGAAAFAKGAFADAATAFETAYSEEPRAASIYNAALSWQSAHDDARAADDFARAASAADLAKDFLADASVQLAKLEATLAKITIDGPTGARASLAHATGPLPEVVHVKDGRYVVHVTYADGTSADFSADAKAGASVHLDVTPHAPPTPTPLPVEVSRTRPGGVLGRPTLPISIALIGAGVVMGGVAIGLGVSTLDAVSGFNASTRTSQSSHDQAVALQAWTNVTLIGALVLGGAGIAALVTVHRVKMQATAGAGSLVLSGAF